MPNFLTQLLSSAASFIENLSGSHPNPPQVTQTASDLRSVALSVETALEPILDTLADEFTAKLPLGTVWDPMLDNVVAGVFAKILDKLPAQTQVNVTAAVAARPTPPVPAPQVTMRPIPDPVQ